jgi:putative tricarboxylic transport membrane protein
MTGLTNVFTLYNIAAIFGGTLLGIFVGAMPGLSATMALALLLPLTFRMDPATGLSMLASLYVGASYGGSIAAILLRTPGTPSAAATVLDGFPMCQKGQAGKALGISLFASFIGGTLSAFALLLAAPLLGTVVVEFGPVELFAIALLGITIIGSLAQGSVINGLFSGVLGLLVSTVGMDLTTGTPRMAFGNINLFSGINFTVALIGLFSIPQALALVENSNAATKVASRITDRLIPRLSELKALMPNILRSSGIGIIVGLIPGTGGDTASWFAYNEAKRFARDKSGFGNGEPGGVAAPEAANNAVVGGALIPTIALGIPGSSATAILLGALMVQGILPGPNLLTDYGDVTYTLIWAVLFANIGLLGVGLMFTKASVMVTKIPDGFVACAIIALCIIGAYAMNNSLFEVGLMLGFGLFGYWLNKAGVSPAPMVIGLILGPVMENAFHQSILIGNGDYRIFLSSPIAVVLLCIAALSVLQATPVFRWLLAPFRRGTRLA